MAQEHDDYADGDPRTGRAPPTAAAVRVLAVVGSLVLLAYVGAAALVRLLTG